MKKVILIVVPLLLLIGGGVFGAAKMGFLKIPGITPVKKKGANLYGAQKLYGEANDPKVAVKPKEAPKPKPKPKSKPKSEPKPEFIRDENVGAEAIAELWNEMPADKLVAMVKDWENDNLARVFRFMDAGQSTKILASLDPKRASSIVKIMQAQASQVPNPELKK